MCIRDRVTLEVPSEMGVLARLSKTIFDLGGNIVSVGSLDRDSASNRHLLIKVRGVGKEELVNAFEELGDHVIDAREV